MERGRGVKGRGERERETETETERDRERQRQREIRATFLSCGRSGKALQLHQSSMHPNYAFSADLSGRLL